jgi:hypothetical protein
MLMYAPPLVPVLRNLREFEPEKLEPEIVYRLPTSRVVFADHDLLQHDFPFLRADRLVKTHPKLQEVGPTRKAIGPILDEWLMTNTAFISESQRGRSLVNTPIETTAEQVVAFRPPRYGRALIFSLEENRRRLSRPHLHSQADAIDGLIDVKGIGVAPKAKPRFATHSNGLMTLAEAIREVIIEKIIDRIFQHSGSCWRAVPSYAVIDTGFDLKWPNGVTQPAGLLVRRAHLRPSCPRGLKDSSSPLVQLELSVELLLRRYGITSASVSTIIEIADSDGKTAIKYGSTLLRYNEDEIKKIKEMASFTGGLKRLDGVNLEFTREAELNPACAQIVDFGGFLVKERFENPIVSLVADRLLRLGEIISPSDPRFVQPDEKIRLPYRFWGETGRIWEYEASEAELLTRIRDNPKILAFNLARAFREKRLTGSDVRDKIEEYLNTSTGFARKA